jgi:hypothetical protein
VLQRRKQVWNCFCKKHLCCIILLKSLSKVCNTIFF